MLVWGNVHKDGEGDERGGHQEEGEPLAQVGGRELVVFLGGEHWDQPEVVRHRHLHL